MTSPSPVPIVNPDPQSRLDALAARYAALKPQADALTEQLKTVTDAIKTELTTLHPQATSLLLTSPHLGAPLSLSAVESWRLDTRKLKAEQPELYVTYARKSTSWRLAAMGR